MANCGTIRKPTVCAVSIGAAWIRGAGFMVTLGRTYLCAVLCVVIRHGLTEIVNGSTVAPTILYPYAQARGRAGSRHRRLRGRPGRNVRPGFRQPADRRTARALRRILAALQR